MQGKGRRVVLRFAAALVLLVTLLVLLLPSILSALAITTINLLASLVAMGLALLATLFLRPIRWFAAAIAAVFVSFPPYPYWIGFNEDGSMKIELLLGAPGIGANMILLVISIGAFWLAFRAVDVLGTGRLCVPGPMNSGAREPDAGVGAGTAE